MQLVMLNTDSTLFILFARGESNKPNGVLHGLSNQQMGNKLQKCGSNPRPLTKPGFDTTLNGQLS